MDRDLAIRLQGMALGVLGNLDAIAHHMKNNLPDDDYNDFILSIATAMAGTSEFMEKLLARHPDATPKELQPDHPK